MEKNIASHDLTDMMIYQRMNEGSRKLYFEETFAFFRKIAGKVITSLEQLERTVRTSVREMRSLYGRQSVYVNTAGAFYAVALASIVISFFWLMLLLNVTI
jgi:hypothetical protein